MLDFLGDTLSDGLNSVLQTILYHTVYKLLYYLDVALCWIVGIMYKIFGVFAGVSEVKYMDGEMVKSDYLLNVFLHDNSIKNVYWDMAMIGIILCFVFTIIAVIRKAADLDGKQQRSFGQILRGTTKSIFIILLMTFIMTAVITATNVLMSAITTSFNRSDSEHRQDSIVYTEEQYAAMARVLNTIGNYSLNSASTSRYNINSCFNEIRPDLYWLQEQGVFSFDYHVKDENGKEVVTWQSALQKVVNAGDLRFDLPMDVYNESVSNAIMGIMDVIKTDGSFRPWTEFKNVYEVDTTETPMDVMMFLMGTSKAANNAAYNEDPSITDNIRGAYYVGAKSIYDVDEVTADFDIAVGKLDHLIIILGAAKVIMDLAICIFNAVARIFNLLLLYLVSPLAVSVSPMDDGGKFKQWTTAFVIQCLSILGIVISMRLLMLYMPLISGSNLILFDNPILNLLAKLILLLGGTEAAKRANGLINGILADNAGMQSIAAGDMSSYAMGAMGATFGLGKAAIGKAAGVAGSVTGISGLGQYLSAKGQQFTKNGGVFGLKKTLTQDAPGYGTNAPGGGGGGVGAAGAAGAAGGAAGGGSDGGAPAQQNAAAADGGNTSAPAASKTVPPVNEQQYNAKYTSPSSSPIDQQNNSQMQ